jgi:sRNA-binding protein
MTTLTLTRPAAPPVDITALSAKAADAMERLTANRKAREASPGPLKFATPSADPNADALLARLGRDFPIAFRPGTVLAVGVRAKLKGFGYGPADLLRAVLARWCRQRSYLEAVARGGHRTALNGLQDGEVTEGHREQAAADLAARPARRPQRSKPRATPSHKRQRSEPVVVFAQPRRRPVLDLRKEQTR